ncbi:MAG: hypothetical protein IPK16_01370 [Anaerolineales bacterium]|nr:hypothetical protein [Anaerolineales bacterium]
MSQTVNIVSVDEGTTLGAAMLGGLAAGVYPDLPTAIEQIRYTSTPIEPNPADAEVYTRIFNDVYQQYYPSVRNLSQSIYAIQQGAHDGQ